MTYHAIIVAGGKGLRMGGELPKQFMEVNGVPVLMRTLQAFYDTVPSIHLILVLPEAHIDFWEELCQRYHFHLPHTVTTGGETRFHSVLNGLKKVTDGIVAVHDGVRPFVAPTVIREAFAVAQKEGAAVPVLPMVDSLRRRHSMEKSSEAVNREEYVAVQTPQVFRADLLLSAYAQPYQPTFTDDASVVEAYGHTVTLIEGNRENIKITTPYDMKVATVLC